MSRRYKGLRELFLREDFGEVAVIVNGIRGESSAAGILLTPLRASANDAAAPAAPRIGDIMPATHKNAGWIYAGISQTTRAPLYAAPKDSGIFNWEAAMAFAAKKKARAPSQEELNQLYETQDTGALKGTFNVSGSYPVGWYWSGESVPSEMSYACCRRLKDGHYDWFRKDGQSALRLVRG